MVVEATELELKENFNWMATRFLIFELENFENVTLTHAVSNGLVDRLLQFHEGLENYEICQKIILYKSKMKDV